MKIAAVTEDGISICQHFGRAPFYKVLTVEGGKVVAEELRAKAGHHTFAQQERNAGHCEGPHGCNAHSQSKHTAMAAAIADCQVLLAGGIGSGAYQNLKGLGIEPVLTDVDRIDAAVESYLNGALPNLMGRLH